jgi:pyruvate kinase
MCSPPDASVPLQDNVGILLDTKGPEIRSGKLLNDTSGHDTIELVAGNSIRLHATSATLPKDGSTDTDLFIDFPMLAKVLEPGRQVLLDDGAVIMTVLTTHPDNHTVTAQILNTGRIRSRAGVNLPLANTAEYLPALSEKDKADIAYGMETADIDFIAASFVQTAQHVIDIRKHCAQIAQQLPDLWKDKPLPLIISKIETASALTHFDEILDISDAIMVARGDLGVEIPLQQVTNAQKEMCAACNAAGKPVIVATQMLESMSKSPRPTRAEVSDVTNAVYDGADCVMCSGETAKGKYPDTTIRTMKEIILCSERYSSNMKALGRPIHHNFLESPKTVSSAMARAAVIASMERHNCAAILVLLQNKPTPPLVVDPTGTTPAPFSLPGLIAAHRPNVPIITFTHSVKQARQLQIFRGIHPVLITPASDIMIEAKKMGYVVPGDEVVLVQEEEDESGTTSTTAAAASMKIVSVPP